MKRIVINFAFIFWFVPSITLLAKVRLPALVSDGMVLQRDTKLKIWGWAEKNEHVKITFRGKHYSTKAEVNGTWSVWIPATSAGGPYTMLIVGKRNNITLNDILVGDVWLCSGQSNMVHSLELHKDRYQQEIARANYPQIRQFLVPSTAVLQGPATDMPSGKWKAANSENILSFSVVAFFFAKNLHQKYHVPIGVINASVGGTPIEAWTSEEGLQEFKDVLHIVHRNKDTAYVNAINRTATIRSQEITKARAIDKGLTDFIKWYEPSYPTGNWNSINIPGYWEDQGIRNLDGIVWYRKEIEIPAAMIGKPAMVALGRIVDADYLYINGVLVGNKTYQYPQRRYNVPANLLKPGKNTFVIRVINTSGKGGFVPDKPYHITSGSDTVDLKGYWKYQVGAVYTHEAGGTGINSQNQPTALFNGMIAPLTHYKLKGLLWYQGESNTGRPEVYEALLPAMIQDWRNKFEQADLPFLFAQLPNFMEVDYTPSESQWARLREAQSKALRIPKTAMAVTIDLGEWNDIHPGNKKPIGDRLALAAQHLAYQEKDMVYSGPVFTASSVTANRVTLTFTQVGSGLTSNDGEDLRWFAVAGEDKKFVWAKTKIIGNEIEVWSDEVGYPAYVRYAWADNPQRVNFYNKEGLPASPFQIQVGDGNRLWHGKKAAVVLTYDDALVEHLDHVLPALNLLGLKATFYLSANFPGSKNRLQDWRNAASQGHELGNHSLFHPCDASKPGRSWVSPHYDLNTYTTEQIVRELEMTNVFLESLDGKKERTFAYTCGDTHTGEGSFINAIKNQFVSMRGVQGSLNTLATLDLTSINCFVVDQSNADQLVSWAEKAKNENALLVILFHGVGGGHSINVDLQTHHDFLAYLKNHSSDYWVTTMLEASKHGIVQLNK